ncbi:hypothetical protein E3_1330 [Rhodococcus phage E3]|uniref:hypothetical protein n=1 Tax=Rhodococcus phage E3 TaxID=1007869 RepID=UPI0002C6CDB2|nr:hypothetical protein M176_gp141 [Rhodococcus phage E3]AEQ21049.1 hypothetical protein E3_1330 [Rhodococcus phage E3]
MRIHTNLDHGDLADAARHAGVIIARSSQHGSRSRERAFEVTLSGSGRTGSRWANSGSYGASSSKAATWDEWGIFLAELFRRDPELKTKEYPSLDAFEWVTVNRFRTLTADRQHVQHRWADVERVAGGRYHISSCKCGAQVRTPSYGHKLADFVIVG